MREVTRVEGSLPIDLRGVWLMYGKFDPPVVGQRVARLYEVTGSGASAIHVHLLRSRLAVPGTGAESAGKSSGQAPAWPSDDYIARWRRRWWRLTDIPPPGYKEIEYRVVGADAYDAALRSDKTAQGSLFSLVVKARYEPAGGPSQQIASVYAARRAGPDLVEGRYVQGTVVAAPFPVPISFRGSFRLYRLARPGERAWLRALLRIWRRLVDGVGGCGKRSAEGTAISGNH